MHNYMNKDLTHNKIYYIHHIDQEFISFMAVPKSMQNCPVWPIKDRPLGGSRFSPRNGSVDLRTLRGSDEIFSTREFVKIWDFFGAWDLRNPESCSFPRRKMFLELHIHADCSWGMYIYIYIYAQTSMAQKPNLKAVAVWLTDHGLPIS